MSDNEPSFPPTSFTECMAVDLAPTAIRVHLVYPGVADWVSQRR